MRHNFEERRQNRIDYAKEQAEKNKQQSNNLSNQAHKMSSIIPMGQPIMIGHHSEVRDRAYRSQIDNKMRGSIEADKKAEYYEEKAEAIEQNDAIFSDDPQALEKLKHKLQGMESEQEFMKAANKCIRKKDKEAFMKLAPFASEELWAKLITPDFAKRTGFPSYKLSNNNANMTTVKKRIASLERLASLTTKQIQGDGFVLIQNVEANRVQFVFETKPSDQIRELLKGQAFKWAPSQNAWQRHLNSAGIYAANTLLNQIKSLLSKSVNQ